MSQITVAPRSVLFMPASKPTMAAKIPDIRPDVAVLDLEDAVQHGAKSQAREQLRAILTQTQLLDGDVPILVRVNEMGSPWIDEDLSLVREIPRVGVVLPKAESPEAVERVRLLLPDRHLMVGVESARGVADARVILEAGPDSCYFGAEDYIVDLGGRRTNAGNEVLYARSQVVLAARLSGAYAVDQVVVAVHDDSAFEADAAVARDLGYNGKLCLHPQQVEVSHRVFSPSPEEVAHARRVVRAAGDGVGLVDGAMVDHVHVRQARDVLARSGGAS
ncbi:citrate lyase subunit beta/citryl-CoA lyase [Antricoccus suffuscus]|uniref:Citrate lyase subunit beta/citryl-CoA lyase n=1 Tax=Antricoccus suffuscus TaxID=1629062 RepID=A0A2T1A6P4_9ACTN|nr:CoA ester lyase [Antricoccus suffuscus]PRZ44269.1 citrate lyase subunit beta/citryl-CoA lyase [Antricoccus suffuscus]